MRGVFASDRKVHDHQIAIFRFLRIDLRDGNLHFRKGAGYGRDNANFILCKDLDHSFVACICCSFGYIPLCTHPTSEILFVFPGLRYVRTIRFVDRNSKSTSNKANNPVSGQRVTAFCKFNLATGLTVNYNATGSATLLGNIRKLDKRKLVLLCNRRSFGFDNLTLSLFFESWKESLERKSSESESVVKILCGLNANLFSDNKNDIIDFFIRDVSCKSSYLVIDLLAANLDVFCSLFFFNTLVIGGF